MCCLSHGSRNRVNASIGDLPATQANRPRSSREDAGGTLISGRWAAPGSCNSNEQIQTLKPHQTPTKKQCKSEWSSLQVRYSESDGGRTTQQNKKNGRAGRIEYLKDTLTVLPRSFRRRRHFHTLERNASSRYKYHNPAVKKDWFILRYIGPGKGA